MAEKLTLHIDGAEHFVLLEAILNWDTSNYVLKDKLEATRESLQTKLEELGEEEMECPCHCRDWVNIRYCNSIYPMCSNCHWCPEIEDKIANPDIIEPEPDDEEIGLPSRGKVSEHKGVAIQVERTPFIFPSANDEESTDG